MAQGRERCRGRISGILSSFPLLQSVLRLALLTKSAWPAILTSPRWPFTAKFPGQGSDAASSNASSNLASAGITQRREPSDDQPTANVIKSPLKQQSPGQQRIESRYLLLCLSVGKYLVELRHVEITGVTDDQHLFLRIREAYRDFRRGAFGPFSLRLPVAVETIKVRYSGPEKANALTFRPVRARPTKARDSLRRCA